MRGLHFRCPEHLISPSHYSCASIHAWANIWAKIFYVPYILVDVPSNWLVKKVGCGVYLPSLITAWGLTSTFLGFTKSYAGLLVARFFLGLCEGGLLGGIVVYLAMFYQRHDMGWRIGLFYCAAPLSGAFGGLLATGLAKINYGGYDGWPWIFFIEGIMTVVYGLMAMYFLPDTPNHAGFLTPEEKVVAMARLRQDSHGSVTEDDVDKEKFDWHWVKMALKSPNLWFCSFAWFLVLVPLYVSCTLETLPVANTLPELFVVFSVNHGRTGLQSCQSSIAHGASICLQFRRGAHYGSELRSLQNARPCHAWRLDRHCLWLHHASCI